MPRPKGSRNKKTLEREAAAKAVVQQQSLLQSQPFSESAADKIAAEATPELPPEATATTQREFIEYTSPLGDRWRVENGKQMLVSFGLTAEEIPKWHEAMAAEKHVWHVLRAHFGVAPMMGESNPEYLRPRSLEEIGKPLGLDSVAVSLLIESAQQYWIKWRMSQKTNVEQPIVAAPVIPEERVEALLAKHGFIDIKDANRRKYVAQRLTDFEHKLGDEESSSLPPQAIRLELQLMNVDGIMDSLATRIASPADEDKDKVDKLHDEMRSWMTMRDKVTTQHLAVMKALDATPEQNPSTQRKVAFIDSLGFLVKAEQEYNARGDTTLIDGIHTAGEIEFLIKPNSLRPAQYRPDLVPLLNDALKHENLWDPNYKPPTLERAAHRRLLAGFHGAVRAATEEDGGVPEMDEDEDGSPEPAMDDSRESMAQTSLPSQSSASGAAATMAFPMSRGKRAGNEFVS